MATDVNSERTPSTPPPIKPLPDIKGRPLWSVMIPAFNCIDYLKITIESVLAQDMGAGKMQIEVVDDCSNDGDVEALVKKIGRERVGYFRQEENKGSLRNFETCINRANGVLVHLLHGDDLVKAGFYEEIEGLFNEYPEIGAAFTKYTYVDEKGNESKPGKDDLDGKRGVVEDWLYKIAQCQRLQPPAMVVKRSVYEHLGSFFAVHYGEDWEMWIRIAAHYPVAYSFKCLALYRSFQNHNANVTSRSIMSGQNIKDIEKVISIAQNYLPKEKRNELKNIARKNFAIHYAKASNRIFQHSKKAAFVQGWGALRMHVNIRTVFYVLRLNLMHLLPFITFKAIKE